MLVFDNYFIDSGLAELWWILAGLLLAGDDPLTLNGDGPSSIGGTGKVDGGEHGCTRAEVARRRGFAASRHGAGCR